MIVKRTVTSNVIVFVTRIGTGRLLGTASVSTFIRAVETEIITRTVFTTVQFTVIFMVAGLVQVLVQVDIVVVVVVTEVLARVTAICRRAVGIGQVKVHGAFIVTEAVRKVQSAGVALIK